MANGFYGGGLVRLLCCLWLFSEATRPRTRTVYVQQVGESAESAEGGDLPMISCNTMSRKTSVYHRKPRLQQLAIHSGVHLRDRVHIVHLSVIHEHGTPRDGYQLEH